MAILEQERHVEIVSGAAERFVITSRMVSATIPAQLPHLNIFVLTVVDRSDATDDTFARVARVSDLSLLPIGRDSALVTTGEYLANSVTLSYTTLNDGLLAATALKDRVNKLIQDWIAFSADFSSPDPSPTQYTLPVGDPSQKTALITAYKVAKQSRYQKSLDKTAADAALTAALADFTYKQGLISDVTGLADATVSNESAFTSAAAAYVTLSDAGTVFIAAASCASTPDKTTFQAALTVAASTATLLANNVADAGSLTTAAASFKTDRIADRDAASTAITSTTANQLLKAQTLTSALATEASALAAVLVVCPDFDSSSIPLLDG